MLSESSTLKKIFLPTIEERFGSLKSLFPKASLDTPASPDYHPELNETPFLDEDSTSLYQSYIGIMRWAIGLGHIDLAHLAHTGATLAKFMASQEIVISFPSSAHLPTQRNT